MLKLFWTDVFLVILGICKSPKSARGLVCAALFYCLVIWAGFIITSAHAAEDGKSFFIGGLAGPMSGVLPPPGTYIASDTIIASAKAGANEAIPDAGLLTVGLQGDTLAEFLSVIWVAPKQVLGGNFALGAGMIAGRADAQVNAILSSIVPVESSSADLDDKVTAFGDPVLIAKLGWHNGPFHWNIGSILNIPVGQYDAGQLVNMGFNRWIIDVTAGFTYFDPKKGIEITVTPGVTFNGKNSDTNYRTGTEFHVDLTAMAHISKQFAIGVGAYHYEQLTGDSGAGAVLGGFKGQVTGIGPVLSYNFHLGNRPISTKLRYFEDFSAENRMPAQVFLLSVAMPLGGSKQ
jgi:hypothetical protein